LICGLYKPVAGTVKVKGKETSSYLRAELFSIFSAVFQDIYLLPTTIERNVSLEKESDTAKVQQVLQLAGMWEKVQQLKYQEQTVLLKSIRDEAVELSGGEIQKLALARALYKGGEIIILDEPTAALDPVAESEMYQKYSALTEDRTSIFISHRLSSTRFCDRIFFLEHGEIVESGTHDELMMLNGKYAQMYRIQSKYYQKDAKEKGL